MNTPEDTFRILRRVPVRDATKLCHLYWMDHTILEIHLRNAGWTYEELCKWFSPAFLDD